MQVLLSWEQLLTFLVVLLFFYYAVVLFFFYRNDLPVFIKARKRVAVRAGATWVRTATPTSTEPPTAADAGLYNAVHELMEDCKPVFQAAVEQSLEKEQVLAALQGRLQKYPSIKGTTFQAALTHHLGQELEHRLGMSLGEPDLERLWQG